MRAPVHLVVLCCVLSVSVTGPNAIAQPGRHEDPLSWDRSVGGLFDRYCYHCHEGSEPSGNVNLARDNNPSLIREQRKQWSVVLEVLESGDMPPEDARQPTDEQRKLMKDFLGETLANNPCDSGIDPGPPVLRRLSNAEYDAAMEDLFGEQLNASRGFPAEQTSFGFSNVGLSANVTPTQMELYHSAAKQAVEQMLSAADKQMFKRVMVSEAEAGAPRQRARMILERFATRAFRRPADEYYVNRLLRIYDQALDEGKSFEEAVGFGLTAILISPNFLLRVEAEQPDVSGPYKISDFELATRLSFFLWSSPPDEKLLALASDGTLGQREVLSKQVKRMLASKRSAGLVDQFFLPWLGLNAMDQHSPDATQFPNVDAALKQSMRMEATMLLGEIVRSDLPITTLIASKHTYLDERLAEHYGISGVRGEALQRVALEDERRGGILSSAAFLMVLSDPDRTNIPRRGNFLAAQFLGDAPPPPPANVPALEIPSGEQPKTLREAFEAHRDRSECRSCHAKIDPLGFTLENYDAVGGWREQENGLLIDSSAQMKGAPVMHGPSGLKAYLLERKEQLAEHFARMLSIYALGRGLEESDECLIRSIVESAAKSDYRVHPMITTLVTSPAFTQRRNSEF